MAYDSGNIFAKILRGEAQAHKVYEDEHTLAFMDLFPQSRGHTLVVPKYDAENIFDAPPEVLGRLIASVQKVAAAVRDALQPDGIQIFQFNGRAAGQSVFHLHFHIVPRFENRPLKGHGQADQADGDELREQARQIASQLQDEDEDVFMEEAAATKRREKAEPSPEPASPGSYDDSGSPGSSGPPEPSGDDDWD